MAKHRKRKLLKRLSLKIVWFSLVSILVCVAGTALFLLLIAITDPKLQNNLIVTTVSTTLLLSSLLGLYIFIFRKSKKTLLRWTKKSFIVLIPLVFIAMLITITSLSSADRSALNSTEGLAGQQGYVEGLSFTGEKLLTLTNVERSKNGKAPLSINIKLNDSAAHKCDDMVKQNYWSHNDKNGVEPWRFIADTGYQYGRLGENLAYGFTSEGAVVTGWINSEGHRQNLLDQAFTEVGFATCLSDNFVNSGKQLIVVQHFGQPKLINNASTPTSTPASQASNIKPFVAGVCTRTTIPYQTVYEDVSYMYVGETREYGGWDGYKETCTADSYGYTTPDHTSPPHDKTVYRGTKQRSSGSGYTPPSTSTSPSPSCVPDGQGGYQC